MLDDPQKSPRNSRKVWYVFSVPKTRPKKPVQLRKIGGMSVAELKSQDFTAMKPAQLGESLRKSAVKKRK
jgi:hypothetical protein